MKDEIKEIIELINTNYKDYYLDDFLSGEDIKKLVDYITNLQEENKSIKTLILQRAYLLDNIDKAIKTLNNDIFKCNYYTMDFEFKFDEYRKDIINILQGSDK